MQEKKQTRPSTSVERPGDGNAERLSEATTGETLGDLRDAEKSVEQGSALSGTTPILTPDSTSGSNDKRADGSDTGGVM